MFGLKLTQMSHFHPFEVVGCKVADTSFQFQGDDMSCSNFIDYTLDFPFWLYCGFIVDIVVSYICRHLPCSNLLDNIFFAHLHFSPFSLFLVF